MTDANLAAVHLRQARKNHPNERARQLIREAEQLLDAEEMQEAEA